MSGPEPMLIGRALGYTWLGLSSTNGSPGLPLARPIYIYYVCGHARASMRVHV
jgi:hypothetical protein